MSKQMPAGNYIQRKSYLQALLSLQVRAARNYIQKISYKKKQWRPAELQVIIAGTGKD
jgi:20S proteasome alpha/beta subunit